MARVPDLVRFCKRHNLVMITVAELARYRLGSNLGGKQSKFDGAFPASSTNAPRANLGVVPPLAGQAFANSRRATTMIHTYALGRAARFYSERTALASAGRRPTFRELHDRVGRIAATLKKQGFAARDPLALLLPNEADYIELIFACAWLGVIAVPLNTRLTAKEIDRVLEQTVPAREA